MGKLFRSLVAAGAISGAAFGFAAVGEFESSVTEQAPAVQTSSAEFHFWEDVAPEAGAVAYGGLLGALAVGGLSAVVSHVVRRRPVVE